MGVDSVDIRQPSAAALTPTAWIRRERFRPTTVDVAPHRVLLDDLTVYTAVLIAGKEHPAGARREVDGADGPLPTMVASWRHAPF